jgi:hypothetical protein
VRDGKELTSCAASRNSTNYISLLSDIEADNATGDIFLITDNLSSHSSAQTRAWMAEHPRLHHVFIPRGACWLNAARRAGGACSGAMRFPVRVLPTPMSLSKPRASPPLNSTDEPSRGSGDVRPRILATIGASFAIAFKERSTRRRKP